MTVVAKRLMSLVVIEAILIPKLRDPKDQMVITTAIAGDAQVIISGDKDLLVLHPFANIEILSPQEFLSYYFSDTLY